MTGFPRSLLALFLFCTLPALAPSVNAWTQGKRIEPNQETTVFASVTNDGATARDVELTLTLPESGTFLRSRRRSARPAG